MTNKRILETSQLNQKHGAANVLGMQSGSLFFSLLIFQRKAYNKLMKGLYEITERILSMLMCIR